MGMVYLATLTIFSAFSHLIQAQKYFFNVQCKQCLILLYYRRKRLCQEMPRTDE